MFTVCNLDESLIIDTVLSYGDITVNNLGNTGVYQHEPWLAVLHRKCSVVNRKSTGVLLSRGPGHYRDNIGKVRTQTYIFYEMCHGIPAVLHRDVPWLHWHSVNEA